MDNASARNLWGDYLDQHLEDAFHEAPKTISFGQDESTASQYAQLVKAGIKKAASYPLLGIQHRNEKLPKIGDYSVVVDGKGQAQCIVKTVKVHLKPYFSIDGEHAQKEGVGDKTLDDWRKTHWEHYRQELEIFGRVPRESMIIVCEEFEKIFER